MAEIDKRIAVLNDRTHEFKFKILRPWLVLGPGDVINSEVIMNRCESRAESTKNGERQVDIDRKENEFYQKQLCCLDGLGNLFHKRL
jgi:hypothetical protein